MGSLGNPKTWVPYLNNKDCSQGFCSLYCPQWCYIIYPPPPPLPFPGGGGGGQSPGSISPLLVAVIGILASAFLLVSYYTIISKYCGRRRSSSSAYAADVASRSDYADDEEPSLHAPWHVAATAGLDEAAIKAIAVCKYCKSRGDGTADCSVCLSEFEEGESVRLLPKCGHAFHVHCIDTWLRSHSNCPLCRASVLAGAAAQESSGSTISDELSATTASEDGFSGQTSGSENVADSGSLRASTDLEERHAIIEVRDETIRRSVSMDFSRRDRVSLAEILRPSCDCEEEEEKGHVDVEECSIERASCSKFINGKVNGCDHRRKGVLHCVMSPVVMKRSVSSGRFFLRRNSVIPL